MGLLGGDNAFRSDFNILQKQLERRIHALQLLTAGSRLLNSHIKNNLFNGWMTISQNWQEDTVIDNYELHCHLIDQFLTSVIMLSKQLEQPIGAPLESSLPKHLSIVHFTTERLPSVIEKIGRVRALATYAAAANDYDSHYGNKLHYAIQCIRDENKSFLQQAKRLESILEKDLNLLDQLKSYEAKLLILLTIVEDDVIKKMGASASANSHRIYTLATDIMDRYLSIVEDGMILISRWHDEDMEAWLMQNEPMKT